MRTSVLLLLLLTIFGCASGVQSLRKVDPGMSPTEVDEIMGRRDSFRSVEKEGSVWTLYQYTNQFCNAHVSLHEKCDFFIIFKDGKVMETGVKNVRGNPPQMSFIYLFQ